jgi:hypothetical protein
MHTRQGVAVPARPNDSVAQQFNQLEKLLAPQWAPLEKLCPPGLCEQFMFMGIVEGVYLYKHVDSRRYLNVDVHGQPYGYDAVACSYFRIPIAVAMRQLAVQL